VAAACATGDAADRPRPADDVVGEVVEVELFDRELLVRNTFDRVVRVRYDAGTPVFYRGQRYPIDALDLGDVVRVDVFGDERGILMAQRIEVEETVEDRGGTRPTPDIEEVDGEVVRVERLPNVLVLDSDARGTLRIGYSADTPVYYRGDQYAITNLEPGDEVRAEVREDAGGDLRTDYVVVTRSVQDREGGTAGGGGGGAGGGDVEAGEVETFTGRVVRVESGRGEFTVDRENGGEVRVLMPLRALTADQDRFQRLRTGDRVRFDGEWLGEGRVVLVRFDLGY
ncbi:MAG TPA: hypothetical protein VHM02_13845, partial [Thermoanaerobaculia bacterium]|nr:hypothetical protein [Thermoanaerobaculia bacterium]